ncbi:hypothetical protein CVT26_004024, partial [Gymnopilus dilepis]
MPSQARKGPEDGENEEDGENKEADGNAIAGPGPSTAANAILRQAQKRPNVHEVVFDNAGQDSCFTIWNEDAGVTIRKGQPPSQMSLDARDYEGDIQMGDPEGDIQMAEGDQCFFPFASELDWKIGQWVIKDGPSQNALDRLLEIPEVVEKLGLSFRTMRALHQKVDSIPERAGQWQERELFFQDEPEE